MRKRRKIKSHKCDESRDGLNRNDKQRTENVQGLCSPVNVDAIKVPLFFAPVM